MKKILSILAACVMLAVCAVSTQYAAQLAGPVQLSNGRTMSPDLFKALGNNITKATTFDHEAVTLREFLLADPQLIKALGGMEQFKKFHKEAKAIGKHATIAQWAKKLTLYIGVPLCVAVIIAAVIYAIQTGDFAGCPMALIHYAKPLISQAWNVLFGAPLANTGPANTVLPIIQPTYPANVTSMANTTLNFATPVNATAHAASWTFSSKFYDLVTWLKSPFVSNASTCAAKPAGFAQSVYGTPAIGAPTVTTMAPKLSPFIHETPNPFLTLSTKPGLTVNTIANAQFAQTAQQAATLEAANAALAAKLAQQIAASKALVTLPTASQQLLGQAAHKALAQRMVQQSAAQHVLNPLGLSSAEAIAMKQALPRLTAQQAALSARAQAINACIKNPQNPLCTPGIPAYTPAIPATAASTSASWFSRIPSMQTIHGYAAQYAIPLVFAGLAHSFGAHVPAH